MFMLNVYDTQFNWDNACQCYNPNYSYMLRNDLYLESDKTLFNVW